MAATYAGAGVESELRQRQLRRAIAASAVGSIVEWYDFLLYATVAGLYLGRLFFPSSNGVASLLASYSTLAVGFVIRPLGAVIFGHYGDRIGRKATLIVTLALMGISTLLIGLVPTYAQIGIWGGVFLVILRIAQGLAVGGEWGGAVLMTVEWAPVKRRGFAGAFAQIGIPVGFVLGFVALQVSTGLLGQNSYWGWRVPFLLSIVLVVIGLYVRLGVLETPVFSKLLEERRVERMPSLTVVAKNPGSIILTTLAKTGQFGPDVLFIVFVLVYLTNVLKVPQSTAILYATIANTVSIFTTLFFGWLSDRVGRKRLIVIGMVAMVLFGVPYYLLLNTRAPLLIVGAMILAAVINDSMNGPQPAFFAELFTGRLRYSGASYGFQLAALTAGGPATLVATALLARYHSAIPIGIYISAMAFVGLCAVLALRERFQQDLDVEYDSDREGAVQTRPVVTA